MKIKITDLISHDRHGINLCDPVMFPEDKRRYQSFLNDLAKEGKLGDIFDSDMYVLNPTYLRID